MSESRPARPDGAVAALLIGALVLMAHGVTLSVPFQFDDIHQIADNPAMREPASLFRFFTDPWIGSAAGHGFFYRPLLFTTFLVDGVIGGGSAIPYRITSLILLALFAILVGRFVRLTLKHLPPDAGEERLEWAGLFAAALIAVHPLLNESVLLATGRSSLLMAVFGIAALSVLAERGERPNAWVACTGLTLAALLVKETAVVTAPLAVLVTWVTHRSHPWWRRLLVAWPVVVPVVAYAAAYTLARDMVGPSPQPYPSAMGHQITAIDRVAEGLVALLGLFRLAIWPVGLSLLHDLPAPGDLLRAVAPVGWVVLVVLAALALKAPRPSIRIVGFAALWFTLALAPIVTAGLNTPMGEHRTVLALTGVVMAAAWGLSAMHRSRALLVAGALVVALSGAAIVQSLPWRSAESLWTSEMQRHPTSSRPWSFLALEYLRRSDLDAARAALDRGLELSPGNVALLTQAATTELLRGNLVDAGAFAAAGLAIQPTYVPLLLAQAESHARSGRLAEALAVANRAVEVAPRWSPSWNALGNVQYMMGDAGSVESYHRAVELDARNAKAVQNLARAQRRWSR